MPLYFNLAPNRHILKETIKDPKALSYGVLFTLVLHSNIALWSDPHHGFFDLVFSSLTTVITALLILNEVGLATVRYNAVQQGFQRPLPPRYGDVFERMLSGRGIYIFLAGLLFILAVCSPFNTNHDLNASVTLVLQTVVLGAAWYGITYSRERYTAWYGEIWPNDDGDGGGWDDIFVPDPTPQDHLTLN